MKGLHRTVTIFLVWIGLCLPTFGQDSDWNRKRQNLVSGLDEIALPGTVGSLCVFGPNAFPVVTAAYEETRLPIIAAADAGKGRVVACSHGGYIEQDHETSDTGKLMLRLARWASQHPEGAIKVGYLREHGLVKTLAKEKHQTVELSKPGLAERLADVDLLLLTGGDFTVQEVPVVQKFISQGGGVIIADAAWVWDGYRKQSGQTLDADHPPNRMLSPVGVVWARGIVKRDSAGGAKVQPKLPVEIHARSAIQQILKKKLQSKDQQAMARVVVEQGFEAIPAGDKLLLPLIEQVVEQVGIRELKAGLSHRRGLSELEQRIAVGSLTVQSLREPVANQRPSPLASQFPAGVDPDVPRVSRTHSLDTNQPRWHCLGLYAAPGEVVTISIPSAATKAGLVARIGCHKDRLWHKASWKRAPEVTRRYPLETVATHIANPFGGLVYVEVPRNCQAGEIKVTVKNAIDAPVYVHGQTSIRQWQQLRQNPGPWAEIGSDKLIFTVPSAKVRELDRPDLVMEYWNEVMDTCADLARIDHDRPSPERFVIDVQISAGYMHAGYPIMAPSNLADEVLDVATLREKGNWGVFHEIGHNHQEPDWTYAGMTEVTVNLFSMYVYDTLHPGKKQHPQVEPASIQQKIDAFEKTGRCEGPWPNLIPYIQLRDEFGWQSYQNVFETYRKLKPGERPKGDLEKRSQWMTRFSEEVGRDLSPFFDYWKIETSPEAKQQISTLPKWTKP